MLTRRIIQNAVEAALAEDAPRGDITSVHAIDDKARGAATLTARESGVVSGIDVFARTFEIQDARISVRTDIGDGERFSAGQRLATVSGPVRGILTAERVALNFVQLMSGVATSTDAFVTAVAGTGTRIVDTRKTLPGLRAFERYAVTCGGGFNHRDNLSDAVMLKDNHLAALRERGIDLTQAIRHIRDTVGHTVHIEVEIDALDQLDDALLGGPDTIMLDNFTVEETSAAVARIDGRTLVEASGNMTVDKVRAVADTGVDIISVGALTHDIHGPDLGLDWLA